MTYGEFANVSAEVLGKPITYNGLTLKLELSTQRPVQVRINQLESVANDKVIHADGDADIDRPHVVPPREGHEEHIAGMERHFEIAERRCRSIGERSGFSGSACGDRR